jgi:hypothetical protein
MSLSDLGLASGILKLGLAAATAAAAAAIVRHLVAGHHPALILAACGLAFAPVYLLCAYIMKAVSGEEIQSLLRISQRVFRLS